MKYRYEYQGLYQNRRNGRTLLGVGRTNSEEAVYKSFDEEIYGSEYNKIGDMRFKMNEKNEVIQTKVVPWKS